MISNKQFIQRAKTALCDKWEKSHQKWLDEQKQKQSEQQEFSKYQSSLQLQAELADMFSQMSAPANLQQVKYTSDLVIETNDKDGNNIYRFKWAKRGEGRIPQVVLNEIKDSLNKTLLENHRRLWNTASTMLYPDNECLINSYPFTANGVRIIACINSLLYIELVIQI